MYQYKAKVLRVVDGDTLDVEFDLGLNVLVRERVRVLEVDTPEKYGRTIANEKRHGEIVTRFVQWLVEGQDVIINTEKDKKGKYGRWLGHVLIIDSNATSAKLDLVLDGIAPTTVREFACYDLKRILSNNDMVKLTKSRYSGFPKNAPYSIESFLSDLERRVDTFIAEK